MTSSVEPTKRNVEIKARVSDDNEFQNRIAIASDLTKSDGEILKQHDIFYKVTNGRLKLRIQVNYIFFILYHYFSVVSDFVCVIFILY